MTLESRLTEKQLFDQLISSIVHSVWIALGKIKNPVNGKFERDLYQASISIDMLDMIYKRMDKSLSEAEEKYLGHILAELKMNYLEEKGGVRQSPDRKNEMKDQQDSTHPKENGSEESFRRKDA
ncbi:MAG: DUF1844 domain-containing protein [FCB group bacterium]|nr:DUF1844 domain-containing protein [FCB group bacterium]